MKIDILIGFFTGAAATLAGIILYIGVFSEMGLLLTLKDSVQNNYLGKIISLGAALNFLPFFVFLNKNQIYKARGVLLASLAIAIVIAVYKFI